MGFQLDQQIRDQMADTQFAGKANRFDKNQLSYGYCHLLTATEVIIRNFNDKFRMMDAECVSGVHVLEL